MPFGLTNAPGTFVHLTQLVLSGLQWTKVVLYLDDIITFGKAFEETLENLELVIQSFKTIKMQILSKVSGIFRSSSISRGDLM